MKKEAMEQERLRSSHIKLKSMVINLASTTKGLAFIDFNKDTETFNDTLIKAFPNGIIQSDDTENQIYIKQLQEYFSGTRRSFNLPLDLRGTPFQIKVWKALMEIPFGETVSYKFIAERIENPKGTRAVGMANNKNKIPIIIPCHRVVGSDGRLVGYGGGMEIKRTLLGLEGIKISEVDDRVIV